jgi:Tfp pilus assembly protein PilX
MTNSPKKARDRGIAMLATIFAILLLSVIGLGMMYSTNMETFINANYRDKQVALYASMAGLQEARDRLQCRSDRSPFDPDLDTECPPTVNIDPPRELPALDNGSVLYIINPKNGETIEPWTAGSRYMDTELCQQNILGLTATPGIPCDTLPTGTWYTVYDNSVTSAGPWKLDRPFDYKWARITVKTNNSTTRAVNGDATNSNRVCWDGVHQVTVPATGDCTKYGSVVAVDVDPEGAGYTAPPTVTIGPPDLMTGIQATAVANMVQASSTEVSSLTLTSGGSGYNSNPTVTFSGGGATVQATAVAEVLGTGQEVASVSLSNSPTACYSSAPAVTLVGGGGGLATATATLAASNTCVANWTIGGKCASRKGETITGIGLSNSSGFSATLSFDSSDGTATVLSIQNPGTTYTGGTPSITGISGCGALTIGQIDPGKRLQSLSLTSGGGGYSAAPAVQILQGTGTTATQPTGTATLGGAPANSGQVTVLTLTSGGAGYTSAPTVTFSGGGATTDATAVANIGDLTYKVGSITVTNQGSGYGTIPSVTITPVGGGGGAMGTAVLGRGSAYGKVYNITALSETSTGARTMYQMEATTPVIGFAPTGALTIAGPDPTINGLPNSNLFFVHGEDANSCGQTPEDTHPAVGGYDDPNDPDDMALQIIKDSIPDDREQYYTGTGSPPSIENIYGTLGETFGTPEGLEGYMAAIASVKTNTGTNVSLGTAGNPAINYIDGDVELLGNATGYGILAVTGTLTMSGNFTWNGAILVIGDGSFQFQGGGNGQINGTVFVAKIYPDPMDHDTLLPELGQPEIGWNGGGGNGIQYDHCWATNMMARIPFDAVPTGKPLKILSLRTLPY